MLAGMIPSTLVDDARRAAEQQSPRLVELRRHLHRHPELSDQEYATSSHLYRLCQAFGEPHYGLDQRGVWVDVGDGDSDRCVAIRADIDALPIQSRLNTPYASQHPGIMHACGHDVHTAMAFGALSVCHQLLSNSAGLRGRVRVIFQPAEETSSGGPHMIRSGALENVTSAVALHVDPTRPLGTFGFREGAFTAGCDVFHCEILGRAGHSARPHLTGDTLAAAAAWITTMHERISRCHDVRDGLVVSVGSIHAGESPNVVPDTAVLSGTIRGLSSDALQAARQTAARVGRAVEQMYEVKVAYRETTHTPPLINDALVVNLARSATIALGGESSCQTIDLPSMGAEDFAFFANRVPAAMMRIGVAGAKIGAQPLHTPLFDIDERALPLGAAMLALTAINLSQLELPSPNESANTL